MNPICLRSCSKAMAAYDMTVMCAVDELSRSEGDPCPHKQKRAEQPKEQPHQIDPVEHPSHYETGKFQCIDVMEEVFGPETVMAFCLCNAFKYLYRSMHKHNTPSEDVRKAAWYIRRWIDLDKAEQEWKESERYQTAIMAFGKATEDDLK